MDDIGKLIQSSVILFVITIISISTSVSPYFMVAMFGLIMTMFTVRSIGVNDGIAEKIIQSAVVILFGIFSGTPLSFLLLHEVDYIRALRIVMPSFICITVYMIRGGKTDAWVLGWGLILACLSAALSIIEEITEKYFNVKRQITDAVSANALGELYEKKINQELALKNYLAEKNARLEERENISRNIHNSVGHSITAAIMTLDAADMLFKTEPEKAHEKMNTANERIRDSLNSIRRAVRILDRENTMISLEDFFRGIEETANSFMIDTKVRVRTDFTDYNLKGQIPEEHAEFLTGAAEELLSNGVRHGKADLFTVSITADSGHIRLTVYDNGKSDFSEENMAEKIEEGYGLKKLMAYAKRCGGRAEFENINGFHSFIMLPLGVEDKKDGD